MSEPKPDRTEMWKALKWTMILLVALLIAVGVFKAYQIATAPARVVSDAAGSVKASANAVLNRLDIPISKQRRFDKLANSAFASLNAMDEMPADGVKARGFRMANFRGAQNRICELTYDFGSGDVPVFIGADNSAHEAAKAVGADADRLIRIVVVSSEETLGLNAEYDEEAGHWELGWRTSSVNKPYPDDWAETPITNILANVPKACEKTP
jgi:hypothetical protein